MVAVYACRCFSKEWGLHAVHGTSADAVCGSPSVNVGLVLESRCWYREGGVIGELTASLQLRHASHSTATL